MTKADAHRVSPLHNVDDFIENCETMVSNNNRKIAVNLVCASDDSPLFHYQQQIMFDHLSKSKGLNVTQTVSSSPGDIFIADNRKYRPLHDRRGRDER